MVNVGVRAQKLFPGGKTIKYDSKNFDKNIEEL